MKEINRAENQCYKCGHVWIPRPRRGARPRAAPPRCPLCRSDNVGPAEESQFVLPVPIDAYHLPVEAKKPTIVRKVLNGVLGIVGIAGAGVLGTIFGIISLVMMIVVPIGGILLLWWLSYFFYDLGWWPLGALTRLAAVISTGGLALAFLAFVFWLLTIVFLLIRGFWSLITTPFGSPRPLTMVLSIATSLALAGGLIATAVNIFSPDSTPDQSVAEMEAYFEKIEPSMAAFVQDRDHYTTVARRVDSEVRSESSPLRRATLYTEWVRAARTWQASVESQAESLKQVVPPPNVEQYHQLQVEVFELTIQFLAEIQRAYNISLTASAQNVAYERAETLNQQINETRDRMFAELQRLGLVP